jgi:hypothetical protein
MRNAKCVFVFKDGKMSYIEFLRTTEGILNDCLATCEPALLSSEPNCRVFVRRLIDSHRKLLTTRRPKATDEETALANRLLERLDQIERYHFGGPDAGKLQ